MIKFVARANMHHLGQFLAGKRADAPQEALQILDIVLRELSSKRYNFPMLVIMLNFICDQWSSHNSSKIDVKLRVWLPIKHFSYTLQKRVLYTRCNIHIYIYIYIFSPMTLVRLVLIILQSLHFVKVLPRREILFFTRYKNATTAWWWLGVMVWILSEYKAYPDGPVLEHW